MKEETRRGVLKTGAAALTAGIAGCSDNENNGNGNANPDNNGNTNKNNQKQQAQIGESTSELLGAVLDPNALYENGAINEDPERTQSNFAMAFPQKAIDEGPEGSERLLESFIGNLPASDEMGANYDDVTSYVFNPHQIETINYDLNEDELVSGLESAGFEQLEGDMDSQGWNLYQVNNPEFYRNTEEMVAAAQGSTVVFARKYTDRDDGVSDPEAAIEVALETYNDEVESYAEGNDFGDKTVSTMKDFIEEEDLGELEDAHIYDAENIANSETSSESKYAGRILLNRFNEDHMLSGGLVVDPDRETMYREMSRDYDDL